MCSYARRLAGRQETNHLQRFFLADIPYIISCVTSCIFFHDKTCFGGQTSTSGIPHWRRSVI